ncbi:hypothetical protein [Leifsonia xyli]|uniref:hypothetical protein n=1 Tax=Leifsonia xyli TaxID=1575 RepID=UPI003D672EB5
MTDHEPKPPRWLAARTTKSALIMAIAYSTLCVLMVVFAATGGSPWYFLLGALLALLAGLEWASFWYLRKHGR